MSVRPVKLSAYNRQRYVLARDNRHQPYPSQSQIKDCAAKSQHHLEKYQDVFHDGPHLGGAGDLEEPDWFD